MIERKWTVSGEIGLKDMGGLTSTRYGLLTTTVFEALKMMGIKIEPIPHPDLHEAREIEAQILERQGDDEQAAAARAGEYDDKEGLKGVLRAIERGRALAAMEVADKFKPVY